MSSSAEFDTMMEENLCKIILSSDFTLIHKVAETSGIRPLIPLLKKNKIWVADDIVTSHLNNSGEAYITDATFYHEIENILSRKLEQVTPEAARNMAGPILRENLDCLVFWGNLLGGVIGLIVHFMEVALTK